MLATVLPINTLPTMAASFPQLVVIRQNSLAEDKLVKNGHIKNYHVVVKNSPFVIQLGIANRNGAFFGKQDHSVNQFSFEARLVYDIEPEKDVSWVKDKPMECKISASEHQPGVVTAELRLKVLSTQHEDLFFKVRFTAFDKATKREISSVCSAPIKVISKSDQVKKKKEPKPKKKRSASDMLMETLCNIEKRQREHCEILYKLLGQPAPPQSESPVPYNLDGVEVEDLDLEEEVNSEVGDLLSEVASCISQQNLIQQVPSTQSFTELVDLHALKRPKQEEPTPNFEVAFSNFLKAYTALAPDERRQEMQKAVASQGQNVAMELMDMLQTEGLQRETPTTAKSQHDTECKCGECPYKAELARIEEFYRDVFSLTASTNPTW